jgi:hypothetical protein
MTGQFVDLFDREKYGVNWRAAVALFAGLMVGWCGYAARLAYEAHQPGVRFRGPSGEEMSWAQVLLGSLPGNLVFYGGAAVIIVSLAHILKKDVQLPLAAGVGFVVWGVLVRAAGIIQAPAFSKLAVLGSLTWPVLALGCLVIAFRLINNKLEAIVLGFVVGGLLDAVVMGLVSSLRPAGIGESAGVSLLQGSVAAVALYAGLSHHLRARGVAFGQSGFLSSAEGTREALFLHIPVARLILMSIVSFGLYQAYWIYRNWRYVKDRAGLAIRPFWRGVFCVFYCHSLLRRIHEDDEARAVQLPSFSPGTLATAWVVLVIAANLVSRAPGVAASMVAAFIPSFLCLVPVQRYVNEVSERRSPGCLYHRWSSGHFVFLFLGVALWAVLLGGLGAA